MRCEIAVRCHLVRDYQELITLTATCLPPRLALSTAALDFALPDPLLDPLADPRLPATDGGGAAGGGVPAEREGGRGGAGRGSDAGGGGDDAAAAAAGVVVPVRGVVAVSSVGDGGRGTIMTTAATPI